MTDKILTQAILKEHLHYNPNTGVFTRLKFTSNRVKNKTDYTRKTKGYPVTTLFLKTYYLHRLAWLYVYGEFPKFYIDHIDGNTENNAISNLRQVTHGQNHQNLGLRKSNSSGYTGVSLDKRTGKWESYIWFNNKKYNLGYFSDIEIARKHYVVAKSLLHTANPVLREL